MESKTINGETFRARSARVIMLSAVDIDVPHRIVHIDRKPNKYGTYIVTVFNEDIEVEYSVYMPARIAESAKVGKRFIYDGLKSKADNSGHTYHSVLRV